MIVILIFRKGSFQGLYRKDPSRANLFNLAMECWSLGIGGGTLLGRLCQFLLGAAFWIGRIDAPFLAEGVNLAGYRFDKIPLYYRTFLLAHEAHNHPYMERLGAMYLMRLRQNNDKHHQCSDSPVSGAHWRILLVAALMPWLMKYKVFYLNNADDDDDSEDDSTKKSRKNIFWKKQFSKAIRLNKIQESMDNQRLLSKEKMVSMQHNMRKNTHLRRSENKALDGVHHSMNTSMKNTNDSLLLASVKEE
jgi:hypothetical protein